MALHIGPVLGEHGAAFLVLLDLPHDRTEAGQLETQLETAYTGE